MRFSKGIVDATETVILKKVVMDVRPQLPCSSNSHDPSTNAFSKNLQTLTCCVFAHVLICVGEAVAKPLNPI